MIASPTPGYCTLTATVRPSRVTARWTWPIEAAAAGSGDQSRKIRSGSPPSSSRTTSAARLGSHRGRIGLEGRQRLLRLLGKGLDDEADQLTGLHQRALHLTELAGHILGRADRRSGLELGAAFVACHPPERPRADDPHAVADGQANDRRSPLEADPLLRGSSDPASSDGDRAADGGYPRGRRDHRAPFSQVSATSTPPP